MQQDHFLFMQLGNLQAKARTSGFPNLTGAEQIFLVVAQLDADVKGGGFEQYYRFEGGNHAVLAPTALLDLDAVLSAGIIARANALFGPDGPPTAPAAREAALDAFSPAQRAQLTALEEEWLEYPDDIIGLLKDVLVGAPPRDDLRNGS